MRTRDGPHDLPRCSSNNLHCRGWPWQGSVSGREIRSTYPRGIRPPRVLNLALPHEPTKVTAGQSTFRGSLLEVQQFLSEGVVALLEFAHQAPDEPRTVNLDVEGLPLFRTFTPALQRDVESRECRRRARAKPGRPAHANATTGAEGNSFSLTR